VTLIDHTSSTNLFTFARDYEQSGKGQVCFTGLDEMFKCSGHESCVRLSGAARIDGARGGISALAAKASGTFRRARRSTRPLVQPTAYEPDQSATGDDLAFMSLSGSDSVPEDVSCLGPKSSALAREELGRLSLSGMYRLPEELRGK
jgi:hypothetical protein